MSRIKLIEPSLEEYWYEQKLLSDPFTMDYNAGYEVSYAGYHYDTGCIDFPKEKWEDNYQKRKNEPNRFFAYIKDVDLNCYVGYVNYHFNQPENKYECGVVIESIHRGKGYSFPALMLLCENAFLNPKITELYDNFEASRINALHVFQKAGFQIVERKQWKKFNKYVNGIVVCIKKDNIEV